MLHPTDIKQHVRNHYRLLFEKKYSASVAVPAGKCLARSLGYPLANLELIPEAYWERFFPCGNPLPLLKPVPGDYILNLGCGAAIDSFALSSLYGHSLNLISLDVVPGVIEEARTLASSLAFPQGRLQWLCADGENLPFEQESFEWIFMNGVFNLFPNKVRLIEGVRRVLKATGTLVVTDLCCTAPLPDYFREEPDAWAWCMSGACTEALLRTMLRRAGFSKMQLFRTEEEDGMFCRIAFSCEKRKQF